MLKAIKIRLYPNKVQQIYINKLLGCYRLVFNKCLDKKITAYNTDKTNLGLSKLGSYFHQELTKTEDFSFLTEHNTKVLKQAILNLLDAYTNFFVNKTGFPKFKSKHDNKQTARFPVDAISLKNEYLAGKLSLTKQLKNLRFECSDKYKKHLDKYKSNIKSATLLKTSSGKYFLSILVDGDLCKKELPEPINDILGIDIGIKSFIVDSFGNEYENLKLTRSNQKKLSILQKRLSKKQKGSKNRTKARIKLARAHEKITNKKINYLHHITNKLIRENQAIVIENLNVKGMMKNHKLARSIQELSIGEFLRQLTYKAEWAKRDIVQIDRFFPSSKLCSHCGHKNQELKLNERFWTCPACDVKHDRDVNAAINIEEEGRRLTGRDNNRALFARI